MKGNDGFHKESGQAVEQIAQGGCGNSVLGDIGNSGGRHPEQQDLTWKLSLF